MTVAVLNRPSARLPRPGLRRGLMVAASLVLHAAVLGPMILLAADDDRPPPRPLPPIIQLEIEPPPPPPQWRLRPQPEEPLQPVEPQSSPPDPVRVEAPRPEPLPAPTPTPQTTPAPARPLTTAPAVAVPGPAPAPSMAPSPAPEPAVAPAPAPARITAPVPTPAPIAPPAPVVAPKPVPTPPIAMERAPSPPAPAPALPQRRLTKDKDEEEDASGRPSPPAPRVAAPPPGGAPAAGAGEITDAWRFAPEGQDGRNARALRVSPAGCPSTGVLTRGERAICEERFNARAAEGAQRAITGSGNAARDARFAREGAREMQRYEAQRRPLAGGVGVMPPQECPGSNFGAGCAGAHLDPSMRQGATTNVQQDSNKLPEPR